MLEKLAEIEARYDQIQSMLADPECAKDAQKLKELMKEIDASTELQEILKNLKDASAVEEFLKKHDCAATVKEFAESIKSQRKDSQGELSDDEASEVSGGVWATSFYGLIWLGDEVPESKRRPAPTPLPEYPILIED